MCELMIVTKRSVHSSKATTDVLYNYKRKLNILLYYVYNIHTTYSACKNVNHIL